MVWDFRTDPEFERRLEWMRDFVRDEVLPLETLSLTFSQFHELIKPLQQKVKNAGLWAAHLTPELGGQGMGQVKLALMHEILGASTLAPPVFGNQAPDSGNSELLALAATDEQKRLWLNPLLAGELVSAFSMTEQGTGSDPTQLTTSAVRDGDQWVIRGRKWFVTNADRAAFHIVMAVTDFDAEPRQRASLILVPTDTPGIITRDIGTMDDPGSVDPVQTHQQVDYDDVRVPFDNLLGGQGEGFRLAQKRLGPGRIHHVMRWLGVCRRAFDMLCERAVSTSVHGSRLADKQTVQNWVADSAAAVESTRLLTLQAAWKIDEYGVADARVDIAMLKYWGTAVLYDVLDHAIQVHGSLGFSTDLPLEHMYRWARASRIYDGPDEVHRVTVARKILARYEPLAVPSEHVPTRREAARERFSDVLDRAALNV